MIDPSPHPPISGLAVSELAVSRGGRLILKNISITLNPGDVLVVRGPNGSGKSSLLRGLAGLIPPTSGTIQWHGDSIRDEGADYHKDLRYLGHRDGLKPTLTAEENLRFIAAWHGSVAMDAAIDSALATFGATSWRHRPVRFLSAGQRRRTALAALVLSPGRLWLLDEPSSSLDQSATDQLRKALTRHCAAGGMAVVATHDGLMVDGARTLNLEGSS